VFDGAWSFSVWFRHVSGSGNDGLFSPDGTLEAFGFTVATPRMFLKMDSSATALFPGAISNDTWYHAVGTKDGSDNIKFYINGSEVATGSSSGSVASDSWRFGYAHTTEFWAGNAMEFAVWNGRALSSSEVSAIYNSGSGKKIPDALGSGYDTSLTGYYPMDTDFDKFAGTGGNNGTVSGATVDNASPTTPIPAREANDKATLVTAEATIDNGITDLDAGNADSAHDLSGFIVQSGSSLVGKTLDTFRVNLCKKSTGTHPAVYLVMNICSTTRRTTCM
jgi:hypothetical protein